METIIAQPETAERILGRLDRLPFLPMHRRISAVMGIGLLFCGIDIVAIAIALPMLMISFHLPLAVAGELIGSVYIGQVMGSLSLGALSEILGRKRLLSIALLLFAGASLVTALAPTFQLLLLGRIAVGIPLGCLVPVSTAYVTEYFPRQLRGRATSAVLFLYTAGFVLAPVVLLILSTVFGQEAWRFLLGLGVAGALVAIFVGRVPESVRWLLHRGRSQQAEEIVDGMEQQALAGLRGQSLANPSPIALRQEKTKWGELFSRRYAARTLLVWVRWFVGAAILVGFASWLPTLYALVGVGQLMIQLLNVLFGLVTLVVLGVYTQSVDRIGRKRMFLLGFGLAVCGAAAGWIAFGVLRSTSWMVLLVTGLPLSMGGYVIVLNNFLSTAELFPTRMRAWALSTSKCIDAIASISLPIIIGILATSLGAVFLLILVLALVAFGLELLLGTETKGAMLEAIAP